MTTEELSEVWCSKCDQPATAELTVNGGGRIYRAAYCGTHLTNLIWAGQARDRADRRAQRGATR